MALYEDIAAQLKTWILDSRYGAGERLPSNRELALAFDTTVPTVRQAVEVLRETGWLRVEHGLGTFAVDVGAPNMLSSLTTRSLDGDHRLETRLLDVDTAIRNEEAAAALGLDSDRPLVRLERLRLIDDRPVILQSSYLSNVHARVLSRYDASGPLYSFLRTRLGLVATRSEESLSAAIPTPSQARLLEVGPQAPLLRSRKRSRTENGEPFMFDDALIVSDQLRIDIDWHGARSALHFTPLHEAADDGDRSGSE